MIVLTKLDNSSIAVNFDSIKYIERIPDTLLHFLNGDSIIVRETLEEISEQVTQLKQKIFQDIG